jgi:hypothetical protein
MGGEGALRLSWWGAVVFVTACTTREGLKPSWIRSSMRRSFEGEMACWTREGLKHPRHNLLLQAIAEGEMACWTREGLEHNAGGRCTSQHGRCIK